MSLEEYVRVSGHDLGCACIRSLDDITEAHEACDCGEDDDDFWDEDEELMA